MVFLSKHFSAVFQQDMFDMFNASFIPRLSLIDVMSCIMGLILSNTQLSYLFVDLILVLLLSRCWQHHSCPNVGVFIEYDNTNLCLICNLFFPISSFSTFMCIVWNITNDAYPFVLPCYYLHHFSHRPPTQLLYQESFQINNPGFDTFLSDGKVFQRPFSCILTTFASTPFSRSISIVRNSLSRWHSNLPNPKKTIKNIFIWFFQAFRTLS